MWFGCCYQPLRDMVKMYVCEFECLWGDMASECGAERRGSDLEVGEPAE